MFYQSKLQLFENLLFWQGSWRYFFLIQFSTRLAQINLEGRVGGKKEGSQKKKKKKQQPEWMTFAKVVNAR